MSHAVRIFDACSGQVSLLRLSESLHVHAHSHCHILIKSGGADDPFQVGDEVHWLTDDSVLAVNAWQPHGQVDIRGRNLLLLTICLEPSWIANAFPVLAHLPARRIFAHPSVRMTPSVRAKARRLEAELLREDVCNFNRFERVLLSLVDELLPNCVGGVQQPCSVLGVPPIDFRIRKALAYMRESAGALNVDGLPEAIGLSRSHFFELFRLCTGLTPKQFGDVLRIESAVTKLGQSSLPIARISENLGFSAASHFSRFFRDHWGIPPSQFRRIVESRADVRAAS